LEWFSDFDRQRPDRAKRRYERFRLARQSSIEVFVACFSVDVVVRERPKRLRNETWIPSAEEYRDESGVPSAGVVEVLIY
jgi:hypothetical protein